jgi:hypothetical protein
VKKGLRSPITNRKFASTANGGIAAALFPRGRIRTEDQLSHDERPAIKKLVDDATHNRTPEANSFVRRSYIGKPQI